MEASQAFTFAPEIAIAKLIRSKAILPDLSKFDETRGEYKE
jgi:hypothetical protein